MAGILSKGIKLSYSSDGSGSSFTTLTNLQEIPEIGNGAKEKLDVTVLEDDVKKYIAGLGDSGQELSFKFLYEKTQFDSLVALEDSVKWKVELPDTTTCTFTGTPVVKLSSAGVNVPLNYTLVITVESKIEFA